MGSAIGKAFGFFIGFLVVFALAASYSVSQEPVEDALAPLHERNVICKNTVMPGAPEITLSHSKGMDVLDYRVASRDGSLTYFTQAGDLCVRATQEQLQQMFGEEEESHPQVQPELPLIEVDLGGILQNDDDNNI